MNYGLIQCKYDALHFIKQSRSHIHYWKAQNQVLKADQRKELDKKFQAVEEELELRKQQEGQRQNIKKPILPQLSANEICWPRCPVQIEINKAIAAATAPQANWTTYRILKIFGSAKSYVDGIRKLKLAEKFSDVDSNSDIDEYSKKKRQSKAKKQMIDSDDEDEQLQRKSKILPPPPRPTILIKNIAGLKSASSSENIEVPQVNDSSDVDDEENSEWITVENTFSQSCEAPQQSVQSNTNIFKQVNKIETKADRLDMVREEVRSLISNRDSPIEYGKGSKIDHIPLRSMEQLQQMERELENSEYYKNMVTFLKGIDKGYSINDATTMIIKRLFINDLAVKYTFGGYKKNKGCFRELCIHKVILKVVHFHFSESTKQEINKAIEKWLIQANLRTKNKRKMSQISLTQRELEAEIQQILFNEDSDVSDVDPFEDSGSDWGEDNLKVESNIDSE
ncbi:hypothetical protein RN001_002807 [Aquatica leii]|uniref:DUF4806 domain-containing protein n=1 Tax=Aquatica leii TaxID=1421715 RepID=A0AAN7PQB3_9COLE|nr:hypothetical protein RN001_002807 [Aquatica leii]